MMSLWRALTSPVERGRTPPAPDKGPRETQRIWAASRSGQSWGGGVGTNPPPPERAGSIPTTRTPPAQRRGVVIAGRGPGADRAEPGIDLMRAEEARLTHRGRHPRAGEVAPLPEDVAVRRVVPDFAVGDALPEDAELVEPVLRFVAG